MRGISYNLIFCIITSNLVRFGTANISHGFGHENQNLNPNLTASTRIVGGTDATPGEIPWQVSIQYVGWVQDVPVYSYHYCGGSIVDETHIVTAAHCVNNELREMVVVAGAHRVRDRREPTQQRMTIKRKAPHPKYNKVTIENDIAVIALSEPLNYTDWVQPIKMAPPGHEPSGSCVASGWGVVNNTNQMYPNVFQRIDLKILPRVPCKKKLSGLKPSMVCAVGSGRDKGTCSGDSGGPLTCFDLPGGLPYLAGAVSWGLAGDCGRIGNPTAFANIANLRPFLDAEIAKP